MHAFSRWMALAALLGGVAARADQNDLQIAKLGNPGPGVENFSDKANRNFQAFARAMSASLTSVNLMPPETLGHAAFNISAELSVVSLPSSIVIPTEGAQPGTVLVPSFHIRKGLPFSVELGGRVGWVEKSRLVAATGEVKWAVNEGFTYLPDIGVRGHVTKLMGAQDLSLTSAGLDAGIGKQFPLGGMVTLTPYGGLDFTFVSARSELIDFDQTRPYNESLGNGSADALANTSAYTRLKFSDNMTQRIYGGVRFIGGVLQLGAELSFTRLGQAPESDLPGSESSSLPTVVTFNTSLGLDF
ncbi:hypothetical protein [Hyalangium sp.]|uniref:hypothetical protein n=1 Tax=Hyalangium sp. TaxID=2028555 RepID=UPI002D6D79FF|nr:hypothetical protein [Hyalangium sp.]HYH98199.1 hypothetical protein [Hyalangium sp.]